MDEAIGPKANGEFAVQGTGLTVVSTECSYIISSGTVNITYTLTGHGHRTPSTIFFATK
jgi:hypothetical protein